MTHRLPDFEILTIPRKCGWREREKIDGSNFPKAAYGEYKVYKIINSVNSKLYIGVTISPLDARFRGHRSDALRKKVTEQIHRAMRKYGVDKFSISLIRNDAKNFKELSEQEVAAIKKYDSIENGYNVSPGGSIGTSKPIVVGGVLFRLMPQLQNIIVSMQRFFQKSAIFWLDTGASCWN